MLHMTIQWLKLNKNQRLNSLKSFVGILENSVVTALQCIWQSKLPRILMQSVSFKPISQKDLWNFRFDKSLKVACLVYKPEQNFHEPTQTLRNFQSLDIGWYKRSRTGKTPMHYHVWYQPKHAKIYPRSGKSPKVFVLSAHRTRVDKIWPVLHAKNMEKAKDPWKNYRLLMTWRKTAVSPLN